MTARDVLAFLVAALWCATAFGQQTGPSSSDAPYILPRAEGVLTVAILTAGDSVNLKPYGLGPYRLAGKADGLGALDNGDGTFTLLVNHEIKDSQGVTRVHGRHGSYVSRWLIEKASLRVIHGKDQIERLLLWDDSTGRHVPDTTAFDKLCSGDLAAPGAYYYPGKNLGVKERLYLCGEEKYDRKGNGEGRALAHVVDGHEAGTTFELPHHGFVSVENVVANPMPSELTITVSLDDVALSDPEVPFLGQVYVYVGEKQSTGTIVERAGLVGGTLYGVNVEGMPAEDREDRDEVPAKRFHLEAIPNEGVRDGKAMEAFSFSQGITGFHRLEDGGWDPNAFTDFYFVSSDRYDTLTKDPGYIPLKNARYPPAIGQAGRTRLWRLRFDDLARPASGGELSMILDGRGPYQCFDNLCVSRDGRILLQEDLGEVAATSRIWEYTIATQALRLVAEFDPARFSRDAPEQDRITLDEESSGIIDASEILGENWFLLTGQPHYRHPDPELVSGSQLLAMFIPPTP